MTARTVHLAEAASYTGNRCRTAWDNVAFPDAPDPVTSDVEAVTCRPCKARMAQEGECPACGGGPLVWSAGPVKLNSVADGRLTMRDVETQFYLGCEECSETVLHGIEPDQVARYLTHRRYWP